MKRRLPLLLLAALVILCGCRHYVITLNNGSQIGTKGKPHLQNGYYVYKDALGQKQYIGAGRVQEIAPASMVNEEKEMFMPGTSK